MLEASEAAGSRAGGTGTGRGEVGATSAFRGTPPRVVVSALTCVEWLIKRPIETACGPTAQE